MILSQEAEIKKAPKPDFLSIALPQIINIYLLLTILITENS